jgi:acetylornithine deacetylase
MPSREAVINALQLLVKTPSVNPTLAPAEGHDERAIAHVCKEWLEHRGIRAWIDEVEPGRCNCVAEVGSGQPVLVLCGHIDTVQTTGMTIPPFEPRVDGNRLFGRGSYDMKGGVAAIMCALEALHQENVQGKIMAALVCDEEFASIGAADFVKRYRADACILTEPSLGSPNELVLAHKGFVWVEVITTGFATHGSRWDLGASAIGKMGRIITALEQFDVEVLRQRVHALVGPASMHCAMVTGGSGWSTYAEECKLKVERRTIPGETADQVLDEIGRVVREAGEDAEVNLVFARSPMTCPSDAAIARSARAALERATGHSPKDAGVAYWMDAAIFDGAGIPTVNFGSNGAGAHEAVEWVDVDTVVITANALVYAARNYVESRPSTHAAMSRSL